MAGSFTLNVVSPNGAIFNDEVEFLVVPGEDGELGILPNHSPLMATLNIGVIRITQNGKVNRMALSGGFMEVGGNKVTLLAESAELADTIDIVRAKAAKERAEQRLASKSAEIDMVRAELALLRAVARLKAAEITKH
ncbi:ATP synthase F1 subcomplex epsilon subunit [Syntrophobotulus glycolicus DSM 8271]|uniref:ATP synthase epsilon chain n=1 Tax=Syntrophobotulus glycolicus (strain DSM 8271 / FlGlyR) TaxID=645991 RepID=F0T2A5_SYNGF|nr:F0F1 ATP synthase subunit epsilon [Syntrophobotulus glycolicus]ADY57533.1 ATP synthase F1 subcomplex epsilon subunit [Syntrophobotulus glycolicus DSM 8271]